MELSVYEKYFILFTKGHFSKYIAPEKVIVGKALMMYAEQVGQDTLLNYAIGLFDKLIRYDCIEGVNSEPFTWIINEMRQISNSLKAPSLYEFLIMHIQDSVVEHLNLELDLDEIKSYMIEKAI